MPKARDVIRILERDGWVVDRITRMNGSRRWFVRHEAGHVVVPVHRSESGHRDGHHGKHSEASGAEMMTFQAIFERAADKTIWGYSPDIPGATGPGDSIESARASLLDGVRLWIDDRRPDARRFGV